MQHLLDYYRKAGKSVSARLSSQLQGDFLMTYSNDRTVQHLAQKYGLAMKEIAMKNTHHAEMTELLIGRDLSWVEN